jgi:Zn finger protein HypA/HybF involved in hydrogenase expression
MTIEEAGQILLENKPYIYCDPCQKNVAARRRLLNEQCPACHAWGVVVNPSYAMACARLGMKAPEPMHVVKEREIDRLIPLGTWARDR